MDGEGSTRQKHVMFFGSEGNRSCLAVLVRKTEESTKRGVEGSASVAGFMRLPSFLKHEAHSSRWRGEATSEPNLNTTVFRRSRQQLW